MSKELFQGIREEQKNYLKKLMLYLNENNQYYMDIFKKNNINVNDDVEGYFDRIPVIEKSNIRSNYNDYISISNERKFSEKTSGSSGIPLVCPKTVSERMKAGLSVWKRRKEWDPKVNPDNFFHLNEIGAYKRIGNFFDYDLNNMRSCFEKLMNVSPRWLCGPTSAIERYCRHIKSGKIEYTNKCIKFVELAGEYSSQEQRELIEEVLECKTINHYGTIETWCIAYECKKGALHVQDNLFFAEMQNKRYLANEQKEVGEITITSFYNKLMPIVRYNIKDIGLVKNVTCECGKTTQIIELMGGRSGDVIAGDSEILGEVLFKRGIYKLMSRGYDCIEGFRVEQVSPKKFIFYLVKGENYSDNATKILNRHIKANLGKDIVVEFKFVGSIPPLPSGKMKIFHSFVNENSLAK